MKIGKLPVVILSLLALSLLGATVSAAPGSLSSGYYITTNYHGQEVPMGTLIIATAYTTDTRVDAVTFIWRQPDSSEAFRDSDVPVVSNGTTFNGNAVYKATSSYTPLIVDGDWGVQAIFLGDGGKTVLGLDVDDVIKIKATSFNTFFVVPEFPIAGTAGSLLAMLAGFGYYIRSRKTPTYLP
jgi:hypothetical protein